MPIVKIVCAMLLASTLMILPASDSHAASLQSVGCAASSGGSQVCPSYDVLYAHDPVFKGAFLRAISTAKITKPSWFPNGVTGGVSAVKIAGRMVLFLMFANRTIVAINLMSFTIHRIVGCQDFITRIQISGSSDL